MKRVLATLLLAGGALFGQAAKADILFTSGSVTPDGPNFKWTYTLTVLSDWVDADAWVSVLDIPGFVPGSALFTPNSGFETSYSGLVESQNSPNSVTDDTLAWDINLDFGPDDVLGEQDLGTLEFLSAYDDTVTTVGSAPWQLTEDGTFDLIFGTAEIVLPGQGPGTEVPEASTVVAMAGLGLLGAAYTVRRRRQA